LKQIATIAWADEQVKSSWALRWNEVYQPAAHVWSSVPVQHFVHHIQLMGLQEPTEGNFDQKPRERPVVQTVSRTGGQEVARPAQPSTEHPRPSDTAPLPSAAKSRVGVSDVEKAVEEIRATLDAVAKSSH
jgi:hypothetical protein